MRGRNPRGHQANWHDAPRRDWTKELDEEIQASFFLSFYRLNMINLWWKITYYSNNCSLCDPIDRDHANKTDISSFYQTLAEENLAFVVQSNRYSKGNREGSRIGTICNILVNEAIGTPVDRYAHVSNFVLNSRGEKCLDYKYAKMIDKLRNVTWTNEAIGCNFQICFLLKKYILEFDLFFTCFTFRETMDLSNLCRIWVFRIIKC